MPQVVYLVEPDAGLASALSQLLASSGFEPHVYGSAEAFLASESEPHGPVVTEVELPGRSGIDLIADLAAWPLARPVIALANRASVATAVRAMQAGAADVLEKPFSMSALLAQLNPAERLRQQRSAD